MRSPRVAALLVLVLSLAFVSPSRLTRTTTTACGRLRGGAGGSKLRDTRAKLEAAFRAIDKDDSGDLTMKEYLRYKKSEFESSKAREWERIETRVVSEFRRIDKNDDGVLTIEEVIQLTMSL